MSQPVAYFRFEAEEVFCIKPNKNVFVSGYKRQKLRVGRSEKTFLFFFLFVFVIKITSLNCDEIGFSMLKI